MIKINLNELVTKIISDAANRDNIGLMEGKMGAVIFLYHYSRYTSNDLYADFAGLLLDDIFDDIQDNSTIFMDRGLAGIGWAIEYILKNNFVTGDSLEILEEIDIRIMGSDISRITDESLSSGLEGLFHYILYHLPSNKTEQIPFDDTYYKRLDMLVAYKNGKCYNADLQHLIALYVDWQKGFDLRYEPSLVLKRLCCVENKPNAINVDEICIGLKQGYAGLGLEQMNIL